MTAAEILKSLKAAGKSQTAAIYRRHGAGDNVFGTLTSDIVKLQKKIKCDHALALELWNSGNAEARVLALQVADPAKITRADADRFAHDGPVRFIDSYLATLLAKSAVANVTMQAWMKSTEESLRELGYALLAARLKRDEQSISDADALKYAGVIEKEIHASPNWARRAMNSALISLAVCKPGARKEAIAAARRIGKVEVDHGETACKTPDAVGYIEKSLARAKA